jgi:mRNA-degrading endonuclease RelE of RelBE toxin-antitoxin system
VTGTVHGVQLEPSAGRQLRELDKARRQRVAHVLEEMVALVKITWPAIQPSVQEGARLNFTAAGVRVEYSIDDRTALLTVHQIKEGPVARTG